MLWIIYALTLGCIIFLIEAANLQILEINQLTTVKGIDIAAINYSEVKDLNTTQCLYKCLLPEKADPVLYKHRDNIKSYAF